LGRSKQRVERGLSCRSIVEGLNFVHCTTVVRTWRKQVCLR
jgi:hypothetical protein